jgi:hypothetical protein
VGYSSLPVQFDESTPDGADYTPQVSVENIRLPSPDSRQRSFPSRLYSVTNLNSN